MKDTTLCFLMDEEREKLLLGMKKRGFGEGKYNGFGGKVEKEESIEEAAIRELYEEVGVETKIEKVEKRGELEFVFPNEEEWDQKVHVFVTKEWNGEPEESEEMKPEWFHVEELPFENMWNDDPHWLPKIIEGKKVEGKFIFQEDNESIKKKIVKEREEDES